MAMALPQGLGIALVAGGTTQAATSEGDWKLGHLWRLRRAGVPVKGQDVGDKRAGMRHRQGDLVDLGLSGRDSREGNRKDDPCA